MPVVKKNKKLPGDDPNFHAIRKYMTPVVYKGKEILGYVASCKQEGCRWSATFANNEGRDKGIQKHRSSKVLEARLDYFARHMSITSPDKIEDALLEVADKHSHTLTDWREAVGTIWGDYTDKPLEEMPAYNSEVQYYMGISAREAARRLVATEYDA